MFKVFLMSWVFGVSLSALAEEKIYVCGQDAVCDGNLNKLSDFRATDIQTKHPITGIVSIQTNNEKREIIVKNGKIDGPYKVYLEKRRVTTENIILPLKYFEVSQHEEAFWKKNHPDFYLYEEGNYKEGNRNSTWKEYYESGQLKKQENYKDGEKEGIWTWYDEKGKLRKQEDYKEGRISVKWYDDAGRVQAEKLLYDQ